MSKQAAFKVAMRDEGVWIVCYFAPMRMYEDPAHPLTGPLFAESAG